MNRSYRPAKFKKLPTAKIGQKRQYDFEDSEDQWNTFESPIVQFGSQNTTNKSTICEQPRSPGTLDVPLDLSEKSLKYEDFRPQLDSTHKEDCLSLKAIEETSLIPMFENRSETFLSTKNRQNSVIRGNHSQCDSRKQYNQTRNSSTENSDKSNLKANQDLDFNYAPGQNSEKMVAVQSVHQTQMQSSHSVAKRCDLQTYGRRSQCNTNIPTRNTDTRVTVENKDKSNSKVPFNITPETILIGNSNMQLVNTRGSMAKLQSRNTEPSQLYLDSNAVRPVKTPVLSRDVNVSKVKRILFKDSPGLLENLTSRKQSKKDTIPEGGNLKATVTSSANNEEKLNIKRRALKNVNKSEILVKQPSRTLKYKEILTTNASKRTSSANWHCNETNNPKSKILDLRKHRSGNKPNIDIITLLHQGVIPDSVKLIYYD